VVTLAVSHDPGWLEADSLVYPGKRWPLEPGSLAAIVFETRRAARVDDYSSLGGSVGDDARTVGVGAGSAAPIIVEGRLWGLIRVFSRRGATLPGGIESQLNAFTELVATALSNAAARADLIASRARIVAAGDEARRRIERNLHDGTQQRLIALGLDLQRIEATLPDDQPDARAGLERMAEDLESLLEDVRELSRGLHPPLLSRGGLRPSLRALARRSPIPVDLDIELQERPPEAIETALYYVASEALTNAIKHSQATTISITVETEHANLQATIADDGVGGAELTEGSGLMGLVDRVDALGGRFELDSPPGLGTRIAVFLPVRTTAAA
jgi:signal transduction histidine kinase